jgi:integrase
VRYGKGGKTRLVPCDELAVSLQAYRIAFGLSPVPAPDERTPLVLSVRRTMWGGWKGIRSRQAIWGVITALRAETVAYARETGLQLDRDELERLGKASTHWLRHSYAKALSEAMKYGLDTRSALDNMGHADERIFRQYVDDEPIKRALATYMARIKSR